MRARKTHKSSLSKSLCQRAARFGISHFGNRRIAEMALPVQVISVRGLHRLFAYGNFLDFYIYPLTSR